MNHRHHHNHKKKQLNWVLFLSLGYMCLEIIGGILSGSLALLADAGHMAIDSLAVALSLFAVWIAQRPATERKTYGYYRAEVLAALVNGATLVSLSFWIFYEAWQRFYEPQLIKGELMTGVAAGGLGVNLLALFLLHKDSHSDLNIRGVWLHVITDTLGSVSALIAGILVWKFQLYFVDPIISVVIGVLILWGAWNLVSECVNVLLEGVPKGLHLAEIRTAIEEVSGVRDVHDLHVWTVTSGVHSLSAHVGMKDDVDHAAMLKSITDMLFVKFSIEHVTIQLEPGGFSHKGVHVEKCVLGH